ncbi:MAG: hypothetical protein OES10_13225 [Gammaproteobacteria bacterium]|nr:hypothetical protein [Gammaproteobacteria bacterium]MDH3757347.1 hypothetical protein [Gammaproteobacteria bacterium]
MTLTVGKYTFSSWLRRGIGRDIVEIDTLGAANGSVLERAVVPVEVNVNTRPVRKEFPLLGPGDVIGISPDNVVRTEPRHWVTDAEPNYLAFVEFYDEDFLWRFTPADAAGNRLRPWLMLAILEEETADQAGEYTRSDARLPLPSITVSSTAALPPHTQTWAWSHVHTNETFSDATEFERFLDSLNTPDHPNADRITSRLMSPRKLQPNTAYGAFVVPAFETGRLAGLGQDPQAAAAQQPAWTDAAGPVELPICYEWRFRTGENEDFESMVKRLEPRIASSAVGIRDMDGEKPGWGLTEGTDIGQIVPTDAKQTVIGLEGALKAPSTRSRPLNIDTSKPFFTQLVTTLNLPEERRNNPATADLPVIAPPIYGEHHALTHEVDAAGNGWLDVLNSDPRNRVPAGFGVRVFREHQENYVARAWAQVQRILESNKVIHFAAVAMQVSQTVYANLAAKLSPERSVMFFSAALRKVRGSPTTLQHLLQTSTLPPAAVSGALRRFLRPRGAFARRIARAHPAFSQATLVAGLADGTLSAAPPRTPAGDLAIDTEITDRVPSHILPAWLLWLIRNRWLFVIVLLVVALLLWLFGGGLMPAATLVVSAVILVAAAERWARTYPVDTNSGPGSIVDPETVAEVLEATPPRQSFRFVETDPVVPPQSGAGREVTTDTEKTSDSADAVTFDRFISFTPGEPGEDSAEAKAFRIAATSLKQRLSFEAPAAERATFDLQNAHAKLTAAVNPLRAFPRRVSATVGFAFDPGWLLEPEHLVPAMAYPDFDDPMYERLRDLSSELLLPNLELIPPNSITLLETNPPFIEAYVCGLNYEGGKELLWRKYPTDRRGSYFRQFWDTRGILARDSGESDEAVSERSKDVTPLDTWPSRSALGSHRNPLRPPGEQLVLTVRGDLLKKYPNTLIYAQKAHIGRDAEGNPVPSRDPVIATVESEEDIEREIRFPVFKAAVDPDIRFFGFDLSIEQAKGAEDPQAETDDWGYFFILQQLPGEPRFGMDLEFSPDNDAETPITWNDLAWTMFAEGQPFIDTGVLPGSFTPAGPGESLAQWGSNSARMASILFQAPVMIAVHATEMLDAT